MITGMVIVINSGIFVHHFVVLKVFVVSEANRVSANLTLNSIPFMMVVLVVKVVVIAVP